MPIAAAPKYLTDASTDETSPEMRFGLLLPIWTPQWKKDTEGSRRAWDWISKLTPEDIKRMKALDARQQAIQSGLNSDAHLSIDAKAIAPFTTGLGNEHPLENGFAFLNPHGLPYLPGSGVKGAVRRAAEELAGVAPGIQWDTESKWTKEAVEVLFGPAEGELQRGALSFWDVIPQIKGDHLMVEIMTPHQGHYYQNGDAPHDSGQPNPISFLTVPPGSTFAFHVVCDLAHLQRLAPDLAREGRWKALMTEAFEHAFDWCGFGAKTAVGYGAMARDKELEGARLREAEARARETEEQARQATLSPLERRMEEIMQRHPDNPGAGLYQAVKGGEWTAAEDRKIVAEKVRQCWSDAGKWMPQFQGTNKKKVQVRDRCREVQAWLEGK